MDRRRHAPARMIMTHTYNHTRNKRGRDNLVNYMREISGETQFGDPIRVHLHTALLDDRGGPSAELVAISDDVVIRLDRVDGPAMTTFAARVRENLFDLFDGLVAIKTLRAAGTLRLSPEVLPFTGRVGDN